MRGSRAGDPLPELDKAGGQLVVTKLDRLGRSPANLIELSAQLQDHGVDLVVLDQDRHLHRDGPDVQILGAIAEFEHALMSERTHDRLAAARARGQKPKLIPRQAKIAQQMYEETGPDGRRVHTVEQIAAEFGVTRPTSTATSTRSQTDRPAYLRHHSSAAWSCLMINETGHRGRRPKHQRSTRTAATTS
ncbi:recombinase family protein [Actinoplanes flavus]|uniref:Recombinase family protein n=1 Tax=Actinoplanes flavus TaxID=2820290 RepID=A0ABS3UZL3_9ACTN|nr:recombinase family protein [Actinoplanes flavus]MBO3744022.1 recombinase family protein [Actinoplanes flavus]